MKSKKIGRILPEVRRRLPVLRRTAHKRLEDRKEDARILRNLALLADLLQLDAGQCVLSEAVVPRIQNRRTDVNDAIVRSLGIKQRKSPR